MGVFGRHEELSVLGSFLDGIPQGPAALLFTGAAGAGKTTLWNEGLQSASERGWRVLTARPVESEAKLSFTALGDLMSGVGDEFAAPLPEPQARALDAALLRIDPGDDLPDSRAVSLAVLGMFRFLADAGPLLVAVDDVQWLDSPTARVLEFVLRRLGTEPVGILATLRADDVGPSPLGIDRALTEERRDRLHVGALAVEALASLLRERVGTPLPHPTVVRIHRLSGGNPFFALEIARAHVRGDAPASGQTLPVPGTLRELVRQQVVALPNDERDALLAVAALAAPTTGAIAAASDGDLAARALARGVEAGLVDIDAEHVRFTHPLFGSAILAEASPGQLRSLHRRLATIATDPEERARHLALGADAPDEAVASALDEGARVARARGAPDAAAELCEMAVRLTPPDRTEARLERLLEAAKQHGAAGDAAHATSILEAAIESAPPGLLRARLLMFLGLIRPADGSWTSALELFGRALLDVGDDVELRGRIEQGLAYAHLFTGNLGAADEHARTALELAEEGGNAGLVAEGLGFVGYVEFALGRGFRRDLLDRAAQLEQVAEDQWVLDETRPSYTRAQLLKYTDQFDESRAGFHSMLDRAVAQGREHPIAAAHWHLAELECWAGRLDQALDHARRSVESAFQMGETSHYRAFALYAQALVEAHRGMVDQARAAATEGRALAERTELMFCEVLHMSVLGFLDLFQGDPEGAARHLGRGSDLLEAMGIEEPALFRLVPDEVEALVALGELDRAAALLDPFQKRAARLDRVWALATGARCRGLLLAALGDVTGALDSLALALDHHEQLPEPFALARTLFCLGRVQRRARLKAEARASFERSLGIYADLGARPWAERAGREARRVGSRAAGPLDLTPTEERVAALVAEGRTNREAADALFMSVNTIEWNLSRIYRKLGVRSRTELAAKLRERP
jgi:DNA-binding CsgD family transcriptional regulator